MVKMIEERALANVLVRLPNGATQASEGFRKLGFGIKAKGERTLTIFGPIALFERIFKAKLRQIKEGGRTYYRAERALDVPAELGKWVESITLPTPHDFF